MLGKSCLTLIVAASDKATIGVGLIRASTPRGPKRAETWVQATVRFISSRNGPHGAFLTS
jgi:hypothetical protein